MYQIYHRNILYIYITEVCYIFISQNMLRILYKYIEYITEIQYVRFIYIHACNYLGNGCIRGKEVIRGNCPIFIGKIYACIDCITLTH